MEEKVCKLCGKSLPAGFAEDKCSLCAIGLVPVEREPLEISSERIEVVSEGRKLSGVTCPHCDAELTLADLKHLECSICGFEFSAEQMNELIRQAELDRSKLTLTPFRDTGLGEKSWPEDAPIW
ncbi:hypothetical protein JW859_12275 [bacterium]|nr:hypothetical protein [bacterium]